jgi:regulator of RNase E activity RraA
MESDPKEEGLNKAVLNDFQRLSTGNISDSLKRLGINGTMVGIHPLFEGATIVAPAFTLRQIPATDASVTRRHSRVVDEIAEIGTVIVVDSGGRMDAANFGEINALRAKMRGLKGFVIDGVTRDLAEIRKMKFPVFAKGVHPSGTKDKVETVSIGLEIECGGIRVRSGDLIIGDDTGVVVVPKERVQEVLPIAQEISESENKILESVKKGKSLKEAYES